MIFRPTPLEGAFILETEAFADERGLFARTWCAEEFLARGLDSAISQCSTSFNIKKGTLRGMHFQKTPHAETKIVRCTAGKIFDVMLDLRRSSKTCKQWFGLELSAENRKALYIPKGFAHGFQTLVDESEVLYMMSSPFHGPSSGGVRWDDPAFAIKWPEEKRRIISGKDRGYPDWADEQTSV